jgi:hypothetical protein
MDRLGLGAALIFLFFAVIWLAQGAYLYAFSLFAVVSLLLILTYGLQDQPVQTADADEYSAIIEMISRIAKQFVELSAFLERERTRIAEGEATVRRLREEKTQLEPVISTQRAAVEAILAAHTARTAKSAWKERIFGFIFGVVASLVASFAYEYFKR